MTIWFIFATMIAATVAALYAPHRRRGMRAVPADSDFDKAIYRDQLIELERDRARGLIGAVEAEAARNEISRRLLQSAKPNAVVASNGRRFQKYAVLLVPLIALPLYIKYGNPQLPAVPLGARLQGAIENQDFAALVATVEQHLAEDPKDIKGWQVLAPAYKREQRWSDAADAYANIMKLQEPNAEAVADYAEMVVVAGGGIVDDQALNAFAEVLKLDASNPRGRYFTALAKKQEGKPSEAKALFEAFLKDTPTDASWRPMLEAELRDLSSAKAPALTDEQIASGQGMSAENQAKMIQGMMDGLEQRLGESSRDLDGWLRLIRARRVANEIDKAQKSYELASGIFRDDPAALETLNGLAKELGLKS
jgi:cytochrome c-type biogenesis protein CcmH